MSITLDLAARAVAAREPVLSRILPDPLPPRGAQAATLSRRFARTAMAAGVAMALVCAATPSWSAPVHDEEAELEALRQQVLALPVFEQIRHDLESRGYTLATGGEASRQEALADEGGAPADPGFCARPGAASGAACEGRGATSRTTASGAGHGAPEDEGPSPSL